jgi:hypothetical protein
VRAWLVVLTITGERITAVDAEQIGQFDVGVLDRN